MGTAGSADQGPVPSFSVSGWNDDGGTGAWMRRSRRVHVDGALAFERADGYSIESDDGS